MQNHGHGHGATSKGSPHQELLYDPEIPTPSHAERALTLASQEGTGTLCTIASDLTGHPYGSFVTFTLDAGDPVFLISELAEHTRNLRGDARASLLVSEPGAGDPLARGRVTLVGEGSVLSGDAADLCREIYLTSHPRAAYYADYTDFHFWKLKVEHIRYIGGYGRMSWVDPAGWRAADADPIAPHAARILKHMNDDHAAALQAYCLAFSKATKVEVATMVGIDRYGFEMSAETPDGPRPIRVAFDAPLQDASDARVQLVALAKRARSV
jgi:hypothetical protein